MTSSFAILMQPLDTRLPIVDGALVPWIRYIVPLRYMARAPTSLKHFKYRKVVFGDKPGVDHFAFHIGEAIGDQRRHYTLS